MPVKVNYFSDYSKRFDFGVPLEDVFPPNDVHPRLKYLFQEAYQMYINSGYNIDLILRQFQGSLEVRLHLKERLVNDVNYNINEGNIETSPGTYFWVIRHFLGLLPIPLLPDIANDNKFDWNGLSENCRLFLQRYEINRRKNNKLDYYIAESLNMLPFEHFLLLYLLIIFIRKISQKHGRYINRKELLCLAKYYSTSICSRPYKPACNGKDDKIFPLLLYLLLRWREIEKHCRTIGHPAYFLESNFLNYEARGGLCIRDNWAQTISFSPDVLTIYRNVAYHSDNNNYLKDTACQTEIIDVVDKFVQKSKSFLRVEDNGEETVHVDSEEKYETITKVSQSEESPPNAKIDEGFNEDNNDYSIAENTFFTAADLTYQDNWSDVVRTTKKTIEKVEEYIYDDYETFSKEEYNQVSKKRNSSLFDKISKIGWTYTPPKNTSRRENDETINSNEQYYASSYYKFEDVIDEKGNYRTNTEDVDNNLNITFKPCKNDSNVPLCHNVTNNGQTHEEGKNRKNFQFKKFKLKLDFLRVLSPKRVANSTPAYETVESKVKYKKMKDFKSNTL